MTLVALLMLLLATLDPVSTLAAQDQGGRAVLLVDSFDDEEQGILKKLDQDDDLPLYAAYEDGEYRVQVIEPGYSGHALGWLDGSFVDAAIGIDVRLVDETTFAYVSVACRANYEEGHTSEYRLSVYPRIHSFALGRVEDDEFTFLSDWEESSSIRAGMATNHLELICIGDRIIAGINGVEVATVEDDQLETGSVWFGVASANGESVADARFDNLVVNGLLADR